MSDCLFCKIINGDIPSKKVYEDDKIFAFYDIDPQAPVHFLVVPKEHISSALEINESNADIVGYIFTKIGDLAREMGFSEKGYRIVNNCGENACQTVKHMHYHVMGGDKLSERMA